MSSSAVPTAGGGGGNGGNGVGAASHSSFSEVLSALSVIHSHDADAQTRARATEFTESIKHNPQQAIQGNHIKQ